MKLLLDENFHFPSIAGLELEAAGETIVTIYRTSRIRRYWRGA